MSGKINEFLDDTLTKLVVKWQSNDFNGNLWFDMLGIA